MPLIDKAIFDELKQMSGDGFINELIDTFLDDAPNMMQDLKTALNANDADSFRRAAHSMKSNAATFGTRMVPPSAASRCEVPVVVLRTKPLRPERSTALPPPSLRMFSALTCVRVGTLTRPPFIAVSVN